MNFMSNARTTNYTDLSSRGLMHNKPKKTDYNKLTNIFLLFSFIVFVGAITFAIQRTTTSTNTRASSDGLPKEVADRGTLPPLSDTEYSYTREILKAPKQFKGEAVPDDYLQQALTMYNKSPKEEVERYVANRLVLYYSMKQALKDTNIAYQEPANQNFYNIEERIGELRTLMKKNILSVADFALIKAQFRNNDNFSEVEAVFGSSAEQVAKEKIDEYAAKMTAQNYEAIAEEANLDEQLQILNDKEKNKVFYGYTDDDNDSPVQETYIFDEEFDEILFSLQPGQPSQVYQLNSLVPYVYFVVYPIRIEEKKYRSTDEIVQNYIKDFTF